MSDIAGIRLIEDLEYADPYEHPEDCVVLLEKAAAEITRLRAELEMARGSIVWALGYTDFRERRDGEGAYWWRKELRLRSGMTPEDCVTIAAALKENSHE